MTSNRPGVPTDGGIEPSTPSRRASPRADAIDSVRFLSGGTEVLIRHGAETYRLSVTRQNRLILTK